MMFKKKFGIILVLCFIFIGLTGCGSNGSSGKSQVYHLGDSFEYNGLKITLGKEYKPDVWPSGQQILVPITIENISGETKELGINFTGFGPDGSEIGMVNGGLSDSDSGTKLKSGGKLEDNIDFVAEKSGEYTIEIDDSKISIVIVVS